MADAKTKANAASVEDFLAAVPDESRRKDCMAIAKMMSRATGYKPKMWGANIVGFGDYHYVYDSGREGDTFLVGFAPRKSDLTLYVMTGFDRHEKLMARLGKFKTGQSCLYIKKLADIDSKVLQQLIDDSVAQLAKVK